MTKVLYADPSCSSSTAIQAIVQPYGTELCPSTFRHFALLMLRALIQELRTYVPLS